MDASELHQILRSSVLASAEGHAYRLMPLTEALDCGRDPRGRHVLPGHLTASAFVISTDSGAFLEIYHATLRRWLRPGGHVEPGESPLEAAIRELTEEVGIVPVLSDNTCQLLDIDCHVIPASPAKGEPEHWHFDVCYGFPLTGMPSPQLELAEVLDFRWTNLNDVSPEGTTSTARIVRAAKQFWGLDERS